ncbi:MAG: hypothetical protein EOM23_02385, partial [Candidatus Moranbacteria bacterium]|nr:hypothetical protein [Candidatus Moranbacteria bacterium]
PVLFAHSEKMESSLSVSNKLYDLLKKYGYFPDIICLAYDRLVLGDFLNAFKDRFINCHPGLLPGFKGFNAIERTSSSSAQFGGCSIHLCNENIDDGAVIIQSVIPLSPCLTKDEYGAKIFNHMKQGLSQVVQWFAEDRVIIKNGKVIIENAEYGTFPDNPSIELFK